MNNDLRSKSTQGLRQSDVIKDQQFKLVFIYPMLIDQSVARYGNLIRSFVSTSMLKEIFISNSLNLVNMASQIHPLTDELGKPLEVRPSVVGSSVGSQVTLNLQQPYSEVNKYDLQQKINEKTAIIRQLLTSDPKLKVFDPYVELITMDNLIDVPVIVGTKALPIDTAVTQFLFLVSIADKLPLNSYQNVKQVFKRISEINPDQAWRLLNNLVPNDKKSPLSHRIVDWFSKLPGSTTLKQYYGKASGSIKKTLGIKSDSSPINSIRKISQKIKTDSTFDDIESLAIVQSAQTNLAQTELFFKFCYDPNLLKSQFGIDVSQGQIQTQISKINNEIKSIFSILIENYISTLSRLGNPVVYSMINIMFPAESDIDELKLINSFVNNLLNDLNPIIFNDLMESVNSSLTSTDSESKIKLLKELCLDKFQTSDNTIRTNSDKIISNEIGSPLASFSDISNFIQILSKVSSSSLTQSKSVEYLLSTVLGTETTTILTRIHNTIKRHLSMVLNELAKKYYPDFNNVSFFRSANADGKSGMYSFDSKTITTLQTQLVDSISPYLYFLFMYNLQIALCNYVSVVDVAVETAKNDVTDYPNYILVVPVQTLESIANAIVAKSWKQLITQESSGKGFVSAVGDNYIKSIVKFMKLRLGVPNLIVIDEAKGEVFYHLMNQSSPQKAKLATLENFIKLTTKQDMTM